MVALGLLVAATVSIGLTALMNMVSWLPAALGIAGTVLTFLWFNSAHCGNTARIAIGQLRDAIYDAVT